MNSLEAMAQQIQRQMGINDRHILMFEKLTQDLVNLQKTNQELLEEMKALESSLKRGVE